MKLNCDLGEGLDEIDATLMPHIDMASIACGGHVGDKDSMARSVELAASYNVIIGAHPSYPDKENFGRKTLDIAPQALIDTLSQQVQDLIEVCQSLETPLTYIKPHGALYNDAWHRPGILQCITKVAHRFELPIVLQANIEQHHTVDCSIISEAFADRAYTDDGTLVPRRFAHAVHDSIEKTIKQAVDISHKKGVFSEGGNWLSLSADTICLHSDSPNAAASAESVRRAIRNQE